jgi:hypothetical protein
MEQVLHADYIPNDVAANVVPTANTGGVVVKLRVYLDAPTKAGTYVVRLTPTLASGSTAGSLQSAAAQTVTITVTAAPADDLVAATATSIINAGETASATADVVVTSDSHSFNNYSCCNNQGHHTEQVSTCCW